jgi:endonuclease/exonuclease/phosphatase (EEP) superfamily protein YafD
MAHDVVDMKILFWNANGINRDLHEFYSYLDSQRVDVALLCETFLKPDTKINFNADYTFHRLDRMTGAKGGLAILVRRGIKHSLLPNFGTKLIEAFGIEVQTVTSKITLITAYVPGGASRQQIDGHYLNDLRLLHNRPESYFICGDFNSKHRLWNCLRANKAGSLLFEELGRSDFLILHPPSPTYCPLSTAKSHTTLDLVFTNGRHEVSQPVCEQAFMSDHLPVTFEIKTTISPVQQDTVPNYKNANWPLFMSLISNSLDLSRLSLDTIESTAQIDEMVSHLTSTINEARIAAIPNISPEKYKLKLPSDLTDLITFRNLSRRQWTHNKYPDLKRFVHKMSDVIKKQITTLRYSDYGQMLSTFEGKTNKLWKVSKLLRKGRRIIPPLKIGTNTRITPHEKAEAIALTLHNAFQEANRNSPMEGEVAHSIQQIQSTETPPIAPEMLASPTEIKRYIKSLKTSKSPGIDGVNNRLLKNLPRKGVVYLTQLINACLNLSYFPTAWKKANIIPILKPGKDPHNPASYRPISLLSSMSKILEKVILRRFNKHISENHLFLQEQFGFREKHSTSHQLFRVVKSVKNGLRNKKSTGMAFLDIEKAFDAVWHDGLLHKMSVCNFPIRIIKIIQSFLSDRTFHVTVGDGESESRNVASGVPQGAVLSPTLYNFFTHDFPTANNVEVALFADDTAVYCTSEDPNVIVRELQTALNAINEYFTTWKVKINASKTQSVFFTRRRTRGLPSSNLSLNGVDIEWTDEAKYLGVTLDKRLTFKSHIQKTTEKIQKLIRILYPLINRRSRLDRKNKILLYKSIFSSIMLYASPVWDACALSHLRLLQTQQNKCLKMILNLHWMHSTSDVHNLAGIPTINELLQTRHARFSNGLTFINNPLIS